MIYYTEGKSGKKVWKKVWKISMEKKSGMFMLYDGNWILEFFLRMDITTRFENELIIQFFYISWY